MNILTTSTAGSAGVAPLAFHRWELPPGFGPRSGGVCLGARPRDLDALLSGAARGVRDTKLLIATGGGMLLRACGRHQCPPRR